MLPPWPALLVALAVLAPREDKRANDKIELANGTKVEGRVVYQDDVELILRKGTRDTLYAMKEVAKVDSRAANLRDAIESYLKGRSGNEEDLADAANNLERLELPDEEFLLRWKLLLLAPANAGYHEALEHQQKDGRWLLKEGEKWLPVEGWLGPRDWKNAWKLPSTHFELKSDTDLGLSIDVLLDLECLYQAFFQRFGKELHSYEVLERIKVEMQSKKRTFAAPMKNVVSWFDPRANVIYVDATKGVDRARLLADGVRALLCNTGSRQRVIDGVIPPWIEAGLATWVAWNMHGELGRAVWDPVPFYEMIDMVAKADPKEPPRLTKLLNSSTAEFDHSERGLVRYAQGFTFVDFLLSSAGEKYRLRFLDYLRSTYRGKGSPPQFYDAVDVAEAEIEGEWLRWVKRCSEEPRTEKK